MSSTTIVSTGPDWLEYDEYREAVLEREAKLARFRELVLDLIPTAADAKWYGWLEALEEERASLLAELGVADCYEAIAP